MANSTISKLREKANTATKRHDKLKEEWEKYREEQLAAAKRLQWATRSDADNDTPICGAYNDPRASHVAALREIERLQVVHKNWVDNQNTFKKRLKDDNTRLHWENRRQSAKMERMKRNPEVTTTTGNLINLNPTEKKDTAIQTDAGNQTDASAVTDKNAQSGAPAQAEVSVQADGSVIVSAEIFNAAQIEYQEYQDLLKTVPSLEEQLGQLQVANSSERARIESLERERAQQLEELNLVQRKYLNALDHIHSLRTPAGTLQDAVDDANMAFEDISKAYQDPAKHMQFVTLLAPGCDLQGHLESLQISAEIVVDGVEKTDDGMEIANEAAAVRQLLQLQN